MNAKFIVTPGGEKLAILPADEYETMRDALVHQRFVNDVISIHVPTPYVSSAPKSNAQPL